MTVIEFVDAIDAMLDAAIKWIMLGSAIASLLLLVVGWAVTRVVKWAWGGGEARVGLNGPERGAQRPPRGLAGLQRPARA